MGAMTVTARENAMIDWLVKGKKKVGDFKACYHS